MGGGGRGFGIFGRGFEGWRWFRALVCGKWVGWLCGGRGREVTFWIGYQYSVIVMEMKVSRSARPNLAVL